jgi:hypothetical protein
MKKKTGKPFKRIHPDLSAIKDKRKKKQEPEVQTITEEEVAKIIDDIFGKG